MKSTKDKFIQIIQYFIIAILLILIAYYSYQRFVLKNNMVSFLNTNFFIILSGSMEPEINIKDLVVIHPKNSTYEPGDIVAFHKHNSVIVHRIKDVEYDENGNKSFVTKGDNNNTTDSDTLAPNDIIGSYRFTIPFLGAILFFVYTNPILTISVLIAIILIYNIVKLAIQSILASKNNINEKDEEK